MIRSRTAESPRGEPASHLVFCGDKALVDADVRVRDWQDVRRLFLAEQPVAAAG